MHLHFDNKKLRLLEIGTTILGFYILLCGPTYVTWRGFAEVITCVIVSYLCFIITQKPTIIA